jgi:hypothetical protein
MMVHTTPVKALTDGPRLAAMPTCPHCGDVLVAPTSAAFAGAGWVRHLWACDECGHTFRTSVKFAVRRVRQRRLAPRPKTLSR